MDICDWFFQIPNSFSKIYHNFEENHIKVDQTWTAFEISNYIVSTSLFAEIEIKKRKELQYSLENIITQKYGSTFSGDSYYYIRYIRRDDANVRED